MKVCEMKKHLLIIVFISFFGTLSAQQYEDFGFQRDPSVIVYDSALNKVSNAWGGGLNSCQFSEIDLNYDGIKDLFIYDRSSSKTVTFINNGTADSINYIFAPEYRESFPEIHNWIELVDYNNDGKEDIFTSSYGSGIAVYENIGDAINGLKFMKVVNTLLTFQNSQYVNLLASIVDFPAISDIDGDGDIDILNFWGMGEYVQFHQNMSMELYGTADSLNYVRQDFCWGGFAEGAYDNSITLNITCPEKGTQAKDTNGIEHTGSTLLALDLNGDSLKDLLIGDVDFPGVIALYNGGTATDALMTSKDTLFPSNTQKIDLMSFPAPCYVDVNNDGKKDLLVSPFDAGTLISENRKSCWMYENTGTASSPVFEYKYNNFLQKDMIDLGAGAYPVLYDYDSDGLKDLFISNFGKHDSSYYSGGFLYSVYRSGISLYKNTGTVISPEFTFITNDFAGIASRKLTGIYPAFGDIDNDGAAEMIIGKSSGKLDLYENLAPGGQPLDMVLSQTDYMGIYVGNTPTQTYPSATPQLFDLDKDSLLDLIIGEKGGTLNFYKNMGTAQVPLYNTLVTDSLGMVDVVKHNVSNYGYSVPCFFTDSAGNTKLFAGSESGFIYYYKNIDGNVNGTFTLEDSLLLYIFDGMRSAVTLADLDNDNFPEMITGNYSGGVTYYEGTAPHLAGISEYYSQGQSIKLFPNPASNELNILLPDGFSKYFYTKIYNAEGSCVLFKKMNCSDNAIVLNISELPAGIYFVSVYGALQRNCYSGKFMINR
jgi:hypothetical protein